MAVRHIGVVLMYVLCAESVAGLECYSCDDCHEVSTATKTIPCDGEKEMDGFLMPLRCTTTRRMTESSVVLERKCQPSGMKGCVTTQSKESKSTICYCSEDLCNNQAIADIPDPPLDSPTSTGPLKCYDCVSCPEISSDTPTKQCERTQLINGIELPVKCGTYIIYDHDTELGGRTSKDTPERNIPSGGSSYATVVRLCAASQSDGCMDIDAEGVNARTCYCSKDYCNSNVVTDVSDYSDANERKSKAGEKNEL